ncbi:MAG: DUF1501 domain-containing protein [Planctomycetota bacterium]|nr:DUF1501 domain-containing protein [Planctomycetota bacterium]
MISPSLRHSVDRHITTPISRRRLLVASGAGLVGLPFGLRPSTIRAANANPIGATAKSTILFFLSGGASQIDTWDMKPDAPAEIRGEFQPITTSAPGVRLCEHLPLLAQRAHHLAVINSVDGTDPTNSHLGYYRHLTGHELDPRSIFVVGERRQQRDDWPFIGSVVASKLPQRGALPNAISFPWIPENPPDIRAGQFAGKLGLEHDPLYVLGNHDTPLSFQAPALVLEGDLTAEKLQHRRSLLQQLDGTRRELDAYRETQTWQTHQERAFSLLASVNTSDAFNLEKEPVELRERYGQSVNGMSLLLARRLVEAEVPFITIYWMQDRKRGSELNCASAGGWDTHGNNFECLKKMLLPQFDQGFSALLDDLSDRGLLDSTMILITSEMGRQPKIGDPRSGGASGAGRDHWTFCLTDILAGGGIRGGQTYGSSDKQGAYPLERRVTPADIAKTVYHTMGITDLWAKDNQGRPYHLQEEGEPLLELL